MAIPKHLISLQLVSILLATILVTAGTVLVLSNDLPQTTAQSHDYPAAGFTFAFGAGYPTGKFMVVDKFENGYALLSSGPISIQTEQLNVLSYSWLPSAEPDEMTFFWRRSDSPEDVERLEISAPGTQLIQLVNESGWNGEVTEFGFFVAGENGKTVKVGQTLLLPDSLKTRIRLSWQAWTIFERWSQQSINFLHGGDFRQLVSLPLLVSCCLLAGLFLFWQISRRRNDFNSRQFLVTAGILFLTAWVLLDIRWAANNLKQIRVSLNNISATPDSQLADADLDGEVFQYVQRLKSNVLGEKPVRILIVGDKEAVDYYLLRAKYHLVPHSVHVVGKFTKKLAPEFLDYVIFFGQPSEISSVPGWTTAWRKKLTQIDRDDWGVVYRVK